jgi:hypothetical protein
LVATQDFCDYLRSDEGRLAFVKAASALSSWNESFRVVYPVKRQLPVNTFTDSTGIMFRKKSNGNAIATENMFFTAAVRDGLACITSTVEGAAQLPQLQKMCLSSWRRGRTCRGAIPCIPASARASSFGSRMTLPKVKKKENMCGQCAG